MVQGAGSIPAPDTAVRATARKGMINMSKINCARPEWYDLRTEPEYEATFDRIPGMSILVEKAGGGTIGRAYVGDWNVEVREGDRSHWVPMTSGGEHTHQEIARMVAEYFLDQSEF